MNTTEKVENKIGDSEINVKSKRIPLNFSFSNDFRKFSKIVKIFDNFIK